MVRIANGQGFWGDSVDAPKNLIRYGNIDYLTLDYLAEVTMSIMQKQKLRDPKAGYARDFVQLVDAIRRPCWLKVSFPAAPRPSTDKPRFASYHAPPG